LLLLFLRRGFFGRHAVYGGDPSVGLHSVLSIDLHIFICSETGSMSAWPSLNWAIVIGRIATMPLESITP
jgi:hypothetical protein